MQHRNISSQIDQINSLITRSREAVGDNIEMQSHWSRYICVLSAGMIENAIKELYSTYAEAQVSKPIARFVNSHLSQIRNPKAQRMLDISAAFSEEWAKDLDNYLSQEGRGEAIDSIMNNRHLVAHGQSRNSNLTLSRMKEYLQKSIEVLEYIERQCER